MFSTITKAQKIIYTCISNAYSIKITGKVTEQSGVGSCSKVQRMVENLRAKTPIGELEELKGLHPNQEKEPLKPWPDNTNPFTGEIGGPRGPEPTRYGDWERKGRVTDF